MILADRVANRSQLSGIDGLAASMIIAAVVVTRSAAGPPPRRCSTPVALLAGSGLGVTSSVVPYVTDQLAMARLPRAT